MIALERPMPKHCGHCPMGYILPEKVIYCGATDRSTDGNDTVRPAYCPLIEIEDMAKEEG